MAELKPGDVAPSFALRDQDEGSVSLGDLRGSRAVLYFFPKADTSG